MATTEFRGHSFESTNLELVNTIQTHFLSIVVQSMIRENSLAIRVTETMKNDNSANDASS